VNHEEKHIINGVIITGFIRVDAASQDSQLYDCRQVTPGYFSVRPNKVPRNFVPVSGRYIGHGAFYVTEDRGVWLSPQWPHRYFWNDIHGPFQYLGDDSKVYSP